MKIVSLELSNFRNYKHALVDFKDGLNILYGKNASGKTNMMESIYLCSIFHSPRTTKDKEMVLIGENSAKVSLVLQKQYRKHTINLHIDEKGKKRVLVDNIPLNRAGELFGVLGVVYFSPDEMKLVKESPQERRRFMDVGLSQQQRSYFYALQRYNKTLKQKNNLLKEWRGNRNINEMLDVWDIG
ncbi:MAG: DNA replication and repair protein RecF, partial [Clostridia bacterium]|nr:DNA replication and repair protein RecF [Clostridia bacterium]